MRRRRLMMGAGATAMLTAAAAPVIGCGTATSAAEMHSRRHNEERERGDETHEP